MALGGKRSSTGSPRGTRTVPKRVIGEAGSPNPISDKNFANGATVPKNPQDLDGIVENQPSLSAFPKRHSVVDSSYIPLSHIIVNAEGDKWPVDYFKQHVGLNDELMPLAKGTAVPHQQYIRINGFIIHVMSPLSQSQDSETKEFSITGEATVFFGLIPNKGDMFIADVGDGRAGMFTVNTTERLSYSKEACYRITYTMTDFLTKEIEQQVVDKTVRTYFFELALVELHESPYLTEEDYNTYINLKEQDTFIKSYFNRTFWSRVAGNIAVPAQVELTHDAYHAKFCEQVGLGSFRNPIMSYTNGYTRTSEIYTIWDVFHDMDADQLSYVHPTFGVAQSQAFWEVTIARGIAWTQYVYTIYPTRDFFTPDDREAIRCTVKPIKEGGNGIKWGDEDIYNNGVCMVDQSIVDEHRFILPRKLIPDDIGGDVDTDDTEWNPEPSWENTEIVPRPLPMYPSIGTDTHYVFSEAFYKLEVDKLSKFESVALEMLRGNPILPSDVAKFCGTIRKLELVQQFYFIPVLLLMIKYSQRGSL